MAKATALHESPEWKQHYAAREIDARLQAETNAAIAQNTYDAIHAAEYDRTARLYSYNKLVLPEKDPQSWTNFYNPQYDNYRNDVGLIRAVPVAGSFIQARYDFGWAYQDLRDGDVIGGVSGAVTGVANTALPGTEAVGLVAAAAKGLAVIKGIGTARTVTKAPSVINAVTPVAEDSGAIAARVQANVAASKAAREASNFDVHMAREADALAPTGGRLGSQATRAHIADVAAELKSRGWQITGGGGEFAEEYLRGAGGGRLGSNWVDITAMKDGRTLRINTIDTLADGITPTAREAAAAAAIRAKTGGHLLLIPKP